MRNVITETYDDQIKILMSETVNRIFFHTFLRSLQDLQL